MSPGCYIKGGPRSWLAGRWLRAEGCEEAAGDALPPRPCGHGGPEAPRGAPAGSRQVPQRRDGRLHRRRLHLPPGHRQSAAADPGRGADPPEPQHGGVPGRFGHAEHHGAHRGAPQPLQRAGGGAAAPDELRLHPHRALRLGQAALHPKRGREHGAGGAAAGGLHHGRGGGDVRPTHRRGQGAIPGPRGAAGQRPALQRHRGRLQNHRQGGGSPRAVERDAAQHRPQRHRQLRGARHLRPDQGRAAAGAAADRQRPLSLRGRFRGRFLRHGGGVAGGRGEDALHERRPRAVPQRAQLPPGPADAGRPRRPLQGVRPLLPAARLLERGDVHLLRAAATRRGAGLAGSFLNPQPLSPAWARCRS